ncbi:hypothetical protein PAPYR_8757 [Paratrimastix pyriformis]|uniref:Uncharacterized protein n=1 Tax=Paratrimastix pyriformis TaxID=342808 RepID=A0ABQ8UH27_9EUKA|nr:hypothetical protein PAPYR_8757 [Paratrimastix pyriformis]
MHFRHHCKALQEYSTEIILGLRHVNDPLFQRHIPPSSHLIGHSNIIHNDPLDLQPISITADHLSAPTRIVIVAFRREPQFVMLSPRLRPSIVKVGTTGGLLPAHPLPARVSYQRAPCHMFETRSLNQVLSRPPSSLSSRTPPSLSPPPTPPPPPADKGGGGPGLGLGPPLHVRMAAAAERFRDVRPTTTTAEQHLNFSSVPPAGPSSPAATDSSTGRPSPRHSPTRRVRPPGHASSPLLPTADPDSTLAQFAGAPPPTAPLARHHRSHQHPHPAPQEEVVDDLRTPDPFPPQPRHPASPPDDVAAASPPASPRHPHHPQEPTIPGPTPARKHHRYPSASASGSAFAEPEVKPDAAERDQPQAVVRKSADAGGEGGTETEPIRQPTAQRAPAPSPTRRRDSPSEVEAEGHEQARRRQTLLQKTIAEMPDDGDDVDDDWKQKMGLRLSDSPEPPNDLGETFRADGVRVILEKSPGDEGRRGGGGERVEEEERHRHPHHKAAYYAQAKLTRVLHELDASPPPPTAPFTPFPGAPVVLPEAAPASAGGVAPMRKETPAGASPLALSLPPNTPPAGPCLTAPPATPPPPTTALTLTPAAALSQHSLTSSSSAVSASTPTAIRAQRSPTTESPHAPSLSTAPRQAVPPPPAPFFSPRVRAISLALSDITQLSGNTAPAGGTARQLSFMRPSLQGSMLIIDGAPGVPPPELLSPTRARGPSPLAGPADGGQEEEEEEGLTIPKTSTSSTCANPAVEEAAQPPTSPTTLSSITNLPWSPDGPLFPQARPTPPTPLAFDAEASIPGPAAPIPHFEPPAPPARRNSLDESLDAMRVARQGKAHSAQTTLYRRPQQVAKALALAATLARRQAADPGAGGMTMRLGGPATSGMVSTGSAMNPSAAGALPGPADDKVVGRPPLGPVVRTTRLQPEREDRYPVLSPVPSVSSVVASGGGPLGGTIQPPATPGPPSPAVSAAGSASPNITPTPTPAGEAPVQLLQQYMSVLQQVCLPDLVCVSVVRTKSPSSILFYGNSPHHLT